MSQFVAIGAASRLVGLRRVLCAAVILASAAFAQSVTGGGTIQGTVKDPGGAAVPKAKVTITHIDTGTANATETNNDGYFATPPIKIGRYKVRVEHPGMKNWEGELVLETGRSVDIEPVLSLGQVNETVIVNETIPLVTTTDPTDGTTLDSKRINELPINGRDMNTLLSDVTPGIEQVIDVNGGVRTSGMMVYSTNYVQDGAASNNREFGGSMNLAGLNRWARCAWRQARRTRSTAVRHRSSRPPRAGAIRCGSRCLKRFATMRSAWRAQGRT
jgi:Carboxypeptidase regulatory-like domain